MKTLRSRDLIETKLCLHMVDGVNPDLIGRGRLFLGCWQASSELVWVGGRVLMDELRGGDC